jgi:hypothetical protein
MWSFEGDGGHGGNPEEKDRTSACTPIEKSRLFALRFPPGDAAVSWTIKEILQ